MSSVSAVAASQVTLTQARIQTQIAVRLLKVARETGGPQRMLDLVAQAADSAAAMMNASMPTATRNLDLYA